MTRPLLRWLAPASAAVVFAGGGTAVSALGSMAHADLPARSAATLITDVAHAHLRGLSGTLEQSANLGLPALPGMAGQGGRSADLTSLLSGTHTLRLWSAGPGRSRLAVLGDGTESDVVSNNGSVWLWSSADHTATHWQLPAHAAADATPPAAARAMTPQQLAEKALAAIDPTTKVTTNGSAVVAGRSAYLLTISPRTTNTLVDSIQIAIDSATHVPTRVQVFATHHSAPALSVGFTSFDPTTPDAARFTFTPPPGAKVVQKTLSSMSGEHAAPQHHSARAASGPRPDVVGSGWSSVAVLPAAMGERVLASQSAASSGPAGELLSHLNRVSGSWGSGRLLSGTLVSVVLADDGRIAIGAVPPATLYAALQRDAARATGR